MFAENNCSDLLGNFKLNFPLIVENPVAPRKKLNPIINTGRWKEHEHKKFLEAVILHGNDWKCVHKYIKSRSSTQARSHAQKFLLKLRKKLKISPIYDSLNGVLKLSNESIQKIIKEIVESSSMKNSHFDKEKLVKLIMGFSNLLIGKMKPSNVSGDFFNYGTGNEGIYMRPYQNLSAEEFNKKVFLIEKIKKRNLFEESLLNSNSTSNHFMIEKLRKGNVESPQQNAETKQNLQISNQNELIKLLLQQQPKSFDPANPNKNVINIISINICNKNEQEASLLGSPSKLKPDMNLNLINLNKPEQLQVNTSNLFVNKDQLESLQSTLNRVSTMSSLNGSIAESPEQKNISFDQDFYEDNSSFFNYQKTLEDEVDGFFNL